MASEICCHLWPAKNITLCTYHRSICQGLDLFWLLRVNRALLKCMYGMEYCPACSLVRYQSAIEKAYLKALYHTIPYDTIVSYHTIPYYTTDIIQKRCIEGYIYNDTILWYIIASKEMRHHTCLIVLDDERMSHLSTKGPYVPYARIQLHP